MKINHRSFRKVRKTKQRQLLSNKIKLVLPELMSRNLILGSRLNTKLKVNSFLNNTELRNQNYLKQLINCSEKLLKDLRFGSDLQKAIKKGNEDLSFLKKQISKDAIIKKYNVVLKTSKELKFNDTEQESKIKVNNLLEKLKKNLKPNYHPISKKTILNENKSFSENVKEATKLFNEQLNLEPIKINNKIKNYFKELNSITKYEKEEKRIRKTFARYVENLHFNNSEIKMLNYKKPETIPIKDGKCINLDDIKKEIFPNMSDIYQRNSDKYNSNYINISNCYSVKNVHGLKFYKKLYKNRSSDNVSFEKLNNNNTSRTIDDENNVNNNNMKINNSYAILKNMIMNHNQHIYDWSIKKYNRISNLIDIKLPELSDYEKLIRAVNIKNKLDNISNNNGKELYINDNKKKNDTETSSNSLKDLSPIRNQLLLLKNNKRLCDQNFFEQRIFKNYSTINLNEKIHFNRRLAMSYSMKNINSKEEENSRSFIDNIEIKSENRYNSKEEGRKSTTKITYEKSSSVNSTKNNVDKNRDPQSIFITRNDYSRFSHKSNSYNKSKSDD